MARLPRLVLPGHPHLVIHRAQGGATALPDDADRRAYRDVLQASAREAGVAVHGYSLTAQEVRLLLTPAEKQGLAQLMQMVGRRYVPAYNKKYARTGTPWEGRFRSTVLEARSHFLACLRFVENPLAGGADAVDTFGRDTAAHSVVGSRAHHLGERVDPLITEHEAFWALGNTPFERQAAYARYLEAGGGLADEERRRIGAAARHGWALGSAAFCDDVGKAGRRVLPAARGRPRKAPAIDI